MVLHHDYWTDRLDFSQKHHQSVKMGGIMRSVKLPRRWAVCRRRSRRWARGACCCPACWCWAAPPRPPRPPRPARTHTLERPLSTCLADTICTLAALLQTPQDNINHQSFFAPVTSTRIGRLKPRSKVHVYKFSVSPSTLTVILVPIWLMFGKETFSTRRKFYPNHFKFQCGILANEVPNKTLLVL